MTKIYKNSSTDIVPIPKTGGLEIPAEGELVVPPGYYEQLKISDGAIEVLALPHITYNDGTNDLSTADATLHILGLFPSKIKTDVPMFADAGNFHFRGTRIFAGTVPAANTSKVFEYMILKEIFITGAVFKAFGSGKFDYFHLEIVAPQGHPAGSPDNEVVLDEFVPSWGFDDTLQILELYKAKLYTYFIIRIEVFHDEATDLDFWMNAPFHEVVE